MKVGARLRSAVCATQVMVVRAAEVDLECGGAAMATDATPGEAGPSAPYDQGTLIGKRYEDTETGLEVLCVTAGEGSLAVAGRPLTLKAAKALPASD